MFVQYWKSLIHVTLQMIDSMSCDNDLKFLQWNCSKCVCVFKCYMEHAGSMVGIFKCTLELVVLFIFNFFNDISLMCTYKERVIFLCAFGFVALNPLLCHIQRSCNLCAFFFWRTILHFCAHCCCAF